MLEVDILVLTVFGKYRGGAELDQLLKLKMLSSLISTLSALRSSVPSSSKDSPAELPLRLRTFRNEAWAAHQSIM